MNEQKGLEEYTLKVMIAHLLEVELCIIYIYLVFTVFSLTKKYNL